ncbi:hypothetical protein SNOG_06930 [Parastagonospora nodorum SN15]|uniref:Uncharacterized protein n=1 Tax=Phaeosphaeria nodorum (strain SN15 / ATCC MYA-4574 / FGSC 10173) TaxID=321614 RepID=Q0UMT4_PHANO|nr:hypothetical protein SNOG_06930 [Parastagonospora nodorum SN15]EAT85581.2 hypothetical protein SNOG_06930 [Parastagonospora nodorum SN15]
MPYTTTSPYHSIPTTLTSDMPSYHYPSSTTVVVLPNHPPKPCAQPEERVLRRGGPQPVRRRLRCAWWHRHPATTCLPRLISSCKAPHSTAILCLDLHLFPTAIGS